jgi:hypothetical protein
MPLARPGPEPTVDHQVVRAVSAGSETPDATGHPVPIRGLYVSYALIDALRSAQLFSAVVPYDGQEKQECVLSGRLTRLDEVDYGGGVRVETRLVAELVNRRTGETLWTGEASESSNIETRTVASVVGAMSHALGTSIARLIASMDQQVPRP